VETGQKGKEMRSIFRIMLLTILTSACLGTIALASASAAVVWTVKGVEQKGETKENVSTSGGVIKLKGDGIEVECKKEAGTGNIKFTTPGKDEEMLVFEKCALTNNVAECVLASELIPFEVKSDLTQVIKTFYDEYTPKVGAFATIKVQNVVGEVCLLKGAYTVAGMALASIGAEAEELPFTLAPPLSKLTINTNAAELEGSFKEKLTGANVGSKLGVV
jgi:hypothetical protein